MGDSGASEYDATSEVRFAVVLYGGVSLAIYMNGIVQELLHLVRATAPSPGGDGLWWADGELTGAGRVYRTLGKLLDQGGVGAGDGPVRTRFVVDIITGTSAGGINGVFLAKALATDRDISALSDLWVKEGDIDSLLNNAGATAGTRLRPQRPPLSVLSGQRMLYLLLAALDRVSGATPRAGVPDPVTSPYADQIDLWITTTDLQGRPVTVQTWNPDRLGEIREADHRTTFHFRYDATEPAVDGQAGVFNTLGPSHDPLLAFAARCTSSFPGAFQAVKLDDLGEVIDGVRPGATAGAAGWIGPSDPKLDPFFAEYGGVGPAAGHSFADGGYLDNQPVDLVMETLPKRRADIPVARRILLVDPDPGAEPVPGQASVVPDVPPVDPLPRDAPRVDLLGTLVKVVSLPRVQTIGGDVDKILALRGPCRVRSSVYAALDAKLLGTAPPPAGVDDGTPADVAYETLRWATAADELGEAIARVGFPIRQYPAGSQHQAIASRIIGAWNAVPADPAGAAPITLDDLDLGFELRRINFVQARLGQRTRQGATTVDDARRIRRALDDAYAAAAARARALRFRDPNPPPDRARVLDAVREQLGVVERNVQFGAPPSELDADLRARVQPGTTLRAALDELLRMFVTALQLDDVRRSARAAVAGDGEAASWFEWFTAYDQATLPLRDLLPGENDDIEVVRVSPRDTWRLVKDPVANPKLAGTQVHHFGGFFSADWRRNDILWGRLDAAERLISALWPDAAPTGQRDELIAEAHAAIIADVLEDPEYRALLTALVANRPAPAPAAKKAAPAAPLPPVDVAAVLAAMKADFRPPPPPPARETVQMAARAARVVDGVARGLPIAPGPLRQVRTWLGRVVQIAAGIVEVALPIRARALVGRHLLDVAVIAAILMIVLGGIVGGPGVTSFGWVVLLTVVGVRLAIGLLASWLTGRAGLILAGVAIAGVVVAALVVYGLLSWSGWPRALALLGIGVGAGLLLGVLLAGGRRRGDGAASRSANRPPGRPVATAALGLVVVLGLAGASVGHGRNELGDRICRMDDSWYRTFTARVAVVSCPPDPTTP